MKNDDNKYRQPIRWLAVKDFIPRRGWPLFCRWGKTKYSQEGSNPLLSMPLADRRRGQRNDAMHRPRRGKNAEAFLNCFEIILNQNMMIAMPELLVLHLQGAHLQRQTEQVDESCRIGVIVQIAGREGSKRVIIQAVR